MHTYVYTLCDTHTLWERERMLWEMNVSSVLFRCCVVTHTVSALSENAWYALLCNIVHTCDNRHSKQRYISTIYIGSLTHSQFWSTKPSYSYAYMDRETDKLKLRRTWAEQFKEMSDTNHDSFNSYTTLYYNHIVCADSRHINSAYQ